MATVAGAGGERMLLRQRRRLQLVDLTNLSSSTSVLTRIKPAARPKPPRAPAPAEASAPAPPPPPPPAALRHRLRLAIASARVAQCENRTREVQSSSCHLKKIKKISKPQVKTGGVLPGASSPSSKKTRKETREEQPHMEPLDQSSGEPLPCQDFID